jgi:hypothetical protein
MNTNVNDYIYMERIVDNDEMYAAWEMMVQVVSVTEKAVQVRCGESNIKVWFPKAALKVTAADYTTIAVSIREWFQVSEWYLKAEKKYGKKTM